MCCQDAVKTLNKAHIKLATDPETLSKWHRRLVMNDDCFDINISRKST